MRLFRLQWITHNGRSGMQKHVKLQYCNHEIEQYINAEKHIPLNNNWKKLSIPHEFCYKHVSQAHQSWKCSRTRNYWKTSWIYSFRKVCNTVRNHFTLIMRFQLWEWQRDGLQKLNTGCLWNYEATKLIFKFLKQNLEQHVSFPNHRQLHILDLIITTVNSLLTQVNSKYQLSFGSFPFSSSLNITPPKPSPLSKQKWLT